MSSTVEDELRLRIIELESELAAAHEEVDRLRDQAAAPSQEKENEIYALDRRATLSETKNKEHANALSLSSKKIISLENAIKAYKFTAKDVAKCLGDCLHGGASIPVTKEELEDMYKTVTTATTTAADAVLALRLAERAVSIFSVLDAELQQSLVDVPPLLRERLRVIPSFEEAMYAHKRGASQVTSDLSRLLSSVEEATLHFDMELQSVQPAGEGGLDDFGPAPLGGSGSVNGDDAATNGGQDGDFAPLTMATFFKGGN
mmetsp:Transcript_87232/g.168997  ORF Transcript_87232/g.168997 Transcript_87232/m.168997 type:complete len:260 (+) Transcript_87232:58-837(+)